MTMHYHRYSAMCTVNSAQGADPGLKKGGSKVMYETLEERNEARSASGVGGWGWVKIDNKHIVNKCC